MRTSQAPRRGTAILIFEQSEHLLTFNDFNSFKFVLKTNNLSNTRATKHCCWGDCKSDSRTGCPEGVFCFIGFGNGFPKPNGKDRKKCLRWVQSYGREHFTIKNVTKDTYEGPAKSFITGFGLLQCYDLSTNFYYKPLKYSPFTETHETHFCEFFTQSRKADIDK